jgi:membrane-associated phospholipid phosphatase
MRLRRIRTQAVDELRSTEDQNPRFWGRLLLWVGLNRPVAWLIGLTAALILFLVWLPSYVRMFFWHGLRSQPILASMTLGFSLLALSLLWSTGQRMDTWGFLFFNLRGRRPPWLDKLMWGFTQIGNGLFIGALALVFYFAGYHLLAYVLVLGAMTLWMMVELVKALVHRGRPFVRLSQARIVGSRASGRSFPSGHTSQAFFMTLLVARNFHTGIWAACLLYAIALLVGITRMYVGAHYPRDVLAGAVLGSAWGLLAVIAYGAAF